MIKQINAGIAVGFTLFGFANHQLLAQQPTQPAKVEKIEVTGSNIKRVDTETAAPILVITREEIERSAQSTVADILRSLPTNTGFSYDETFTNSFSPGASGIALRGLGQKSTLVLVNGRRVANFGFAQNIQDTYVDLNSIPSSAVERIEVLKDGASAVYGSDAIGGVVNIILRKDYRGIELAARGGRSTEKGLGERKISLTAGFGDMARNRFNVMAVLDYYHRDMLLYSDREFSRDQDFRSLPGGFLGLSATAGTYQIGSNRIPFATCPTSQILPASIFNTTLTGQVCSYNPAPFLTLFPEADRLGFISRGTFSLSSDLSAFAEVFYSKNENNQKFTPAGISGSGIVFDPRSGGVRTVAAVLPVGNPSNPRNQTTQFGYTFFDVGGRDSLIETKFYRALAGVKGTFRSWDWELAAGISRSESENIGANRVDAVLLEQVIRDGTYNFLNPSATPQVTERLRLNTVREAESKLSFADFKLTGDLMQLPAGPVGFAAGVDYRRESIKDRPDPLLAQGRVLGFGSTATDGSRNNVAGYLEFGVPAHKTVELQLAARYDRYSDFGNAFSPKVGVKWTPFKQWLLRSSYGRGFRAPTLPEISPSTALSFVAITDPRLNLSYNIARLSISNPNLEAERSRNLTVGFVFEPTAAFSFAADYYRIRQNDLVARDAPQFVVNNEGQPGFEGRLFRDSTTGRVSYVTTPYANLVFVQTSGYDFDYRLRLPATDFGKFTISGQWSYLKEYKRPAAAGQPATERAGSNSFSAFPRFRGNSRLTWDYGSWTVQLTGNYIHSYRQAFLVTGADPTVKSHPTMDVYLGYRGIKDLTLYTSVLNVTDRQPPFDRSAGEGYDFTIYNLRGRYIQVGLNYKFR